MSTTLSITAEWEHLDKGSAAERACFAALGISTGDNWLTEAEDAFVKRVRQKVHLSGYALAEWLAWNYWRLCSEPPDLSRRDWAMAHRLSTIGGGYIWPNITIQSDGERVGIVARPTPSRAAEPLRYIASQIIGVPATEFVSAVNIFVEQVIGQLRAERVEITNLDRLWEDVRSERADASAKRHRELEAMLGFEPDEAPETTIEQLTTDAAVVGERAMEEIAAAAGPGKSVESVNQLRVWADSAGVQTRSVDVVKLPDKRPFARTGDVPAWRRGSDAAQALRAQEGLGLEPLRDATLAEMAAINRKALERKALEEADGVGFSFVLDDTPNAGKVVLRKTPWKANRRFDLARLLGDRLMSVGGDRLFPATKALTYRQKWQRAFAAELLCPFEALQDKLAGDLSDESIEGAAQYFEVSELAARMILVSHAVLERGDVNMAASAA